MVSQKKAAKISMVLEPEDSDHVEKEITLSDIENFVLKAGSDDLPTFGGEFEGGCHCQQLYDEIAPCILELLESGERIKDYLEIGVAAGGTTFILNHFFEFEKIVLVDDNRHHKAGLRRGVLGGLKYHEMIGKSNEKRIIDAATEAGPYDMIFVDGDHRYEGVDQDTGNYFSMLRKNGFILFHDSALTDWGVNRFVEEFKLDPSSNFIAEYVSKSKTVRPCGVALFQKII